ncbi:hypothetical protein LF845_03990 [Deferribacterales bacterium Es71-Z0220]|uniref:diacylglycerol/lipid kinase family protein n=1 Tax=Deferrivibrio essentukiensis TaxID=2880922 RepID=UPI001F6070F7|nr:diacylglycerol kinase family protein [Deferrivibrio essentukiensis]MCB4204120.1 hypothetical protein [Deferrivibrio essentukiensis]
MSFYAIYNPASGSYSKSKIDYIIKYFSDNYSIDLVAVESKYQGFAKDFFESKNPKLVIIIGGDGFIRDVVEGLYYNKIKTKIYFIPLGTVNVLCRELSIGSNYKTALKRFDINSTALPMRIGIAGDRVFIQMMGFGLDAVSVKNINLNIKKYIGKYAYVISGIKGMLMKYTTINVFFDKKFYKPCHMIVSIGNLYAGSFKIYNKKSDYFKVLMAEKNNFKEILKYLIHIFTFYKCLPIFLTNVIKIENVKDAQLDGDYVNFDGKDLLIRLVTTDLSILKPRG